MAGQGERPVRVNRGRQRVAMVKMEKESNLQVTFSKRRAGLFKKASELCTLCAAEMAIIVFSPGNKVFSFGHSSVDAVLARYTGRPAPPPALVDAQRAASLRDLNLDVARLATEVESERRRGEEMNRARRAAVETGGEWWRAPVDGLRCEARLRRLSRALKDLKDAVADRTDRIMMQTTAAATALSGPQPFNFVQGVDFHNQVFTFTNTSNRDVAVNIATILAGIPPPAPAPAPAPADPNNNHPAGHFGLGNARGFY